MGFCEHLLLVHLKLSLNEVLLVIRSGSPLVLGMGEFEIRFLVPVIDTLSWNLTLQLLAMVARGGYALVLVGIVSIGLAKRPDCMGLITDLVEIFRHISTSNLWW